MATTRKRLDESFTWPSEVRLHDTLRLFTQAIEARLVPLDEKAVGFDDTVTALRQVLIDRINEVLLPAYELIEDQLNQGFSSTRILDSGAYGRQLLGSGTRANALTALALTQGDIKDLSAVLAAFSAALGQNARDADARVQALIDDIADGYNTTPPATADDSARVITSSYFQLAMRTYYGASWKTSPNFVGATISYLAPSANGSTVASTMWIRLLLQGMFGLLYESAPTVATPPTTNDTLRIANTTWVRALLIAAFGASWATAPAIGTATATTPDAADDSTKVTTTGWVRALLASAFGASWATAPALGAATGTSPAVGDDSTRLSTTAWVRGRLVAGFGALWASAPFLGTGTVTTPAANDYSARVSNTQWVSDYIGAIVNTINAALAVRLRFDASQTVTTAQQDQAATNLGLTDRFIRLDGSNTGAFSHRNKFVNGNMEVWQRGVSQPATQANNGRMVADMVRAIFNGTAATMSYDRLIETDLLRTRMRIQTSTLATGSDQTRNDLKFYIENARQFSTKKVAVSFVMAKFGTGGNFSITGVSLFQNFGTGGSPSAEVACPVSIPASDLLFTASDKRVTVIFDVPSVVGKTLGTNGDDHLYILIGMPLNVTFKLEIGELQIEEMGALGSNVPTPFERLTPGEYLALCQRYYEKSYDIDTTPGATTTNGQLTAKPAAAQTAPLLGNARFCRSKRAVPSVTLYSPSGGSTSTSIRNQTANTEAAGTVSYIGTGGFGVLATAAVAANDTVATQWTADASFP